MSPLPVRATVVWIGLLIATCATLWISKGHLLGSENARIAAGIALAIAFVKARYIALDFMELRSATTRLRLIFETWILTVGAVSVALLVA